MMGSEARTNFGAKEGCKLCRKIEPLCESHILPAFAYRWLKNRSGKGHLRHTDNPNRRVQDGIKLKWLCKQCEGIFSGFETEFANRAFYPWTKDKKQIVYGDWMLKFCVSVSWRVLTYAYGRNADTLYTTDQMRHIDRAETVWRDFLSGKTKDLNRYQQHLLVFDFVEETTISNLPNNFNRFMTGAITLDIIGSSRSLMTFAKIGPFTIIGMILKGGTIWRGTKIKSGRGRLISEKIELSLPLLDFIKERASAAAEALEAISPVQREKIEQHVTANLESFLHSDQFRAIEADARLFGFEAVTSKAFNGDTQP
jgi:hypothetical protein